jgi:hypothetical protein
MKESKREDKLDTPLNKYLENQSIVLSYLWEKLKISRFLRWGYENDAPIVCDNAFLHFSSHLCLRSAILDLCALFDDHKYQAFNFYQLLNPKKKFIQELNEESIENIKKELSKASILFPPVKSARDKEIAHYRFEESAINFSHALLPTLVELYMIAEEIFEIATFGQKNETKKSYAVEIHFDDGSSQDYLKSLHRLLKKINQIDYTTLWMRHTTKQAMERLNKPL